MAGTMDPALYRCACSHGQTSADSESARWHQHSRTVFSRLHAAQRRWFVGMLSRQPNRVSDSELAQIPPVNPKTIRRGRREGAAAGPAGLPTRPRPGGAGRPAAEKKIRCLNR